MLRSLLVVPLLLLLPPPLFAAAGTQRVNSRFRNLDDENDVAESRLVNEGETATLEEPKWRVNHRFLKFDTDPSGASGGRSFLNVSALVEDVVKRVKELTGTRTKRSDDADDEGLTTKHLNDIVDFVVEVLRDHVLENGLDTLTLPDVYETFQRRVLVTTLSGAFRGTGGWVRRLSTVVRTGDVRGRRHGPGVLSLSAALGLRQLSAGFQQYEARINGIGGLSGTVAADVGANSVRLNVTFSARPDGSRCEVHLRGLVVERLDDVNVRATGLRPFNWMLSRFATWAVRGQRDNIGKAIERLVGSALGGQVPGAVPCDADFINAFSFA